MWPFRTKEEKQNEKQIRALEQQAKLKQAQLKAAEIDDEVIGAVKIGNLFQQLTSGAKSTEEIEMRIRHWAEQAGMSTEYLKKNYRFMEQVEKLTALDEQNINKLDKMMKLSKEHKKLLQIT